MAPRIPPDPAEVSIRSERDAYAEAIPPGDVTAPCRGPVNVRAVYDDLWNTPLTNVDLRIGDMSGIALDGGLHTNSLMSYGTEDGADIAAIREYLGTARYADVKRGPVTVETIPEPSAEEQALALERKIIAELKAFAASMETSIQPWIDEWENSGWWGLLGDFFDAIRKGLVAWWEGEGEFWSTVGDWISNLPEMVEDLAGATYDMTRALWESRGQVIELLQNLASGAVDAFEAGMRKLRDMLRSALAHIPGLAEIGPLLVDLVDNSAEWAGAMIEVATRTDVLRVLGATTVGILMLIPPNFWAEVIGTGAGYLIPEAIIAILFLIVAAFTGGSAGTALTARLTVFAGNVVGRMRTLTGSAGRAVVTMFAFLRGMVDKLAELVRLLLLSRKERAVGATDDEIRLLRKARRHEVPCFDLPPGADPAEFDRQLAEQMAEINSMTADDMAYAHYVLDQARAEHARQVAQGLRPKGSSFTDLLRDGGAQRKARNYYEEELIRDGLTEGQIEEKMAQVNATHFLDIIAGGDPKKVGIGGAAANQAIGRQWIQGGRASGLGTAAQGMRQDGLAGSHMDVNLVRCGKGKN